MDYIVHGVAKIWTRLFTLQVIILGSAESSLAFFHKMLWKNPNELWGQPNIILLNNSQFQLLENVDDKNTT